jgi:uncharacterized membrane protein
MQDELQQKSATKGTLHKERPPADAPSTLPAIRHVPVGAPFDWLRRGWRDFQAAALSSVFYGMVFALMGRTVTYVLRHAYEYVWALTSGFLLVGPFLAIGLYQLSRQHESGLPLRLGPTLTAWRPNVASIGIFGLVLGVILLLWSRASLVVIAVSFPDQMPSFEHFIANAASVENLQFLVAYLAIGGFFAGLVFAISVVAVPMMLDRNTDGIVAALTSLRACHDNPRTMLVWGALITGLTVLGFASFYLGLVVVVPVIGHATWHAYRDLVGPSPATGG